MLTFFKKIFLWLFCLCRPTHEEAAQWRESLDRVLNNNCTSFSLFLYSCTCSVFFFQKPQTISSQKELKNSVWKMRNIFWLKVMWDNAKCVVWKSSKVQLKMGRPAWLIHLGRVLVTSLLVCNPWVFLTSSFVVQMYSTHMLMKFLFFFFFFGRLIWLHGRSAAGSTASSLESFLIVNNLSHCTLTDSKLFGHGPAAFLRLMDIHSDGLWCFFLLPGIKTLLLWSWYVGSRASLLWNPFIFTHFCPKARSKQWEKKIYLKVI